ncbi:MAG: YaiO family outer membrane beta-barrel protein [Legionella sp.]|nr:YaiO family outer membrane beta-barrel protein [Legionella sp.]
MKTSPILIAHLLLIILLSLLARDTYSFHPGQKITNELMEIKMEYQARNFERVIQLGEPYVNNTPNDVDAYLYVALSYYQLKKYSEARSFFKAMLILQPNNLDGISGLVRTLIALEDYNQALIAVDQGLLYFSNDQTLLDYRQKLLLLIHTKDTEHTLEVVNLAIKSILPRIYYLDKSDSLFPQPIKQTEAEPFPNKEKVIKEVLDIKEVRKWYKEGNYRKVITEATPYLLNYPNDSDIRLYLAFSYYKIKDNTAAVKNFKMILETTPDYKEAQTGLLRSSSQLKIKNKLLLKDTNKKIRDKRRVVVKKFRIKTLPPVETESVSIGDKPHWNLIATSLNSMVTNPDQVWDWSSLLLYRKNQYGSFGGGINYANRLGRDDIQGMINFQPKLSNKVWLDLTYAGANNPYLFPNVILKGEIFALLTPSIQVSLGDDYRKINGRTYFNTLLGSAGIYVENYFISFSPKYYRPNAGSCSTLYTITGTRYSNENPNKFLSLVFSWGTSPDLFDLVTVNFIRVRERIIFIQGQQPLNDKFFIIYGAGFEEQVFPNGLKRTLSYGNMGLKFRFA